MVLHSTKLLRAQEKKIAEKSVMDEFSKFSLLDSSKNSQIDLLNSRNED